MSAAQLDELAKRAQKLAADLRAKKPSATLALEAGVTDCSYRTVRYGVVASYSGAATVTMDDGTRWRCVGHGPQGDAEYVTRQGWIEMIPLDAGPIDPPEVEWDEEDEYDKVELFRAAVEALR
jgi:hypothetical protein